MTDRELEQQLRAWYAGEVSETESAPADLRDAVGTIPATTRAPLRPLTGRRGVTLLAAAAILMVGGALTAVSGVVRPSPVVTPPPDLAVVPPTTSPTAVPSLPRASLRTGSWIAFVRPVDKRPCLRERCSKSRIWLVGSDGTGAHELFPDGTANQGEPTWTSDGAHLLFIEDDRFYMTDANGSAPQVGDTGCVTPCMRDSQLAISPDGTRIAFVREQTGDGDRPYSATITTMDLATGRVDRLTATSSDATAGPSWSPDSSQIAFFRYGSKDTGGPAAPTLSSIWVVDADGQNLRQISPPTVAAEYPQWSPDGGSILFRSSGAGGQDLYLVQPSGLSHGRLTSDGVSGFARWTPDGRILYARGFGSGGGDVMPGWWTMNADGSGSTLLIAFSDIGVDTSGLAFTLPAWQPLGGAAIVPLPWTPVPEVVVGPPAPTPVPTPTPPLSPGFTWTAPATAADGTALGSTATRLADGRVLVTAGCGTAAAVYDPSSSTFSPTGSLSVVRSSSTATLLRDGRVLFAGGYDCAPGGQDGIWASAELYDPATGTFSPTGSMHAPREDQTATLLDDGRVLIAGGLTGPSPAASSPIILASYRLIETDSGFLATAEIYDPLTGTFSETGSMSSPHRGHTATLLKDGRVLVVGNGGESSPSSKVADLYDPATGRFTRTGSMKVGRWLQTATLLPDGRVLILGGRSPKDAVHASAEIYDPRKGTFSPAGSMGEGRQQHTATLLPDGRVLIAGGFWSDGRDWRVLSSTEMYDPVTKDFTALGSMGAPRDGHTATVLDDGRVLIVGGGDIRPDGGVAVTSSVVYTP